jgi:cytochrome c oxidase cbb3-type subunit III
MKNPIKIALLLSGLLVSLPLFGQESTFTTISKWSGGSVIEFTLLGIALVLLFIILMLSRFYSKLIRNKISEQSGNKSYTKGILPFVLLALPGFEHSILLNITANMSTTAYTFIVVIILIELLVILYLVGNINKLMQSNEELFAEVRRAEAPSKLGIWSLALWHRMNKSVAVENEEEIISHHEFDGIRELDNDLPPWWVWGFYITIIFSVIYLWRYHVSHSAPLPEEELQIAMLKAEQNMAANRATTTNLIDETNVEYNSDEAWLERGRQVYKGYCLACHGSAGEGGVGPNLTDDYWIHGGDIKNIYRVVKEGVIEKGMTPWKDLLSPTQIAQVSSFVKSLRGTNPANPKEPQGELFEEKEELIIEETQGTTETKL